MKTFRGSHSKSHSLLDPNVAVPNPRPLGCVGLEGVLPSCPLLNYRLLNFPTRVMATPTVIRDYTFDELGIALICKESTNIWSEKTLPASIANAASLKWTAHPSGTLQKIQHDEEPTDSVADFGLQP